MDFFAHLGLLPLLEEGLLSDFLVRLLPREVSLLADLLDRLVVDALQVHLHRRRDHVARVDPPQGDAVDFVGAGDEEDALREVLEEDDALAAETAGEEDEDGAGGEGGAGAGGFDGFADLHGELCQRGLQRVVLVLHIGYRYGNLSVRGLLAPECPSQPLR